ncbi:calcium-binding and coiled-coil domain-containing protein 1 isoform X1 [Polypterus senegalus]|uniref:calcium-binding and coiled-coil domain-containing protein 1 isoform X1 n=2 Tax=Polypterus senegalus TaxID=55291 RepID=UPI00196408D1|nr:calcium-binding and coiled-coil domain-containing protein 1 isoform X1 [Polypterus senegalus]
MEWLQVSVSQDCPMEKVTFHNVAQSYIPQSRVECHYTLSPAHAWSSKDWIGIFKVGWNSIRDYHTFVWSQVPDGYQEGTPAKCCVNFQAFYLPKGSSESYQFCYVDSQGEVCSCSTPFTFSAPQTLDELVTLEGEDGVASDMLFIIPKAEMLQGRLEECQQEKSQLLESNAEMKHEMAELQMRSADLKRALSWAEGRYSLLLEKYQKGLQDKQVVTSERDILIQQQAENQKQICELEEDIKVISGKVLEKETELDRMKDHLKKVILMQEEQAKSLEGEDQDKERLQERAETLQEQVRDLQDQLSASQQKAEVLAEELASALSTRDHATLKLKKTLLLTAELNAQLADSTLAWKEGRTQWLQEKTVLLNSLEVEKEKILNLSCEVLKLEESLQKERIDKERFRLERDCSLVQLGDAMQTVKELKSTLVAIQKERDQLAVEKEELFDYMRKLEQRLEKMADSKWSEVESSCATRPNSPTTTDSEDELPEDVRPTCQRRPYNLTIEKGSFCAPPPLPSRMPQGGVVISQPTAISTSQSSNERQDPKWESDSSGDKECLVSKVPSSGGETAAQLSETTCSIIRLPSRTGDSDEDLGELASASPWKEGPFCREPTAGLEGAH